MYTKETRSIVTCNVIVWGSFFDDNAQLFFASVTLLTTIRVWGWEGGGGGQTPFINHKVPSHCRLSVCAHCSVLTKHIFCRTVLFYTTWTVGFSAVYIIIIFKGTVLPYKISLKVIPLNRARIGHKPLYICFNHSCLDFEFLNRVQIFLLLNRKISPISSVFVRRLV